MQAVTTPTINNAIIAKKSLNSSSTINKKKINCYNAVKSKDITLLKTLPGIDIPSLRTGLTPLQLAVKAEYVEIVEILLNRGADINKRDPEGRHLIHLAVLGRELLNSKNRKDIITLLFAAAVSKNKIKFDINAPIVKTNKTSLYDVGKTALSLLLQHTKYLYWRSLTDFMISRGAYVIQRIEWKIERLLWIPFYKERNLLLTIDQGNNAFSFFSLLPFEIIKVILDYCKSKTDYLPLTNKKRETALKELAIISNQIELLANNNNGNAIVSLNIPQTDIIAIERKIVQNCGNVANVYTSRMYSQLNNFKLQLKHQFVIKLLRLISENYQRIKISLLLLNKHNNNVNNNSLLNMVTDESITIDKFLINLRTMKHSTLSKQKESLETILNYFQNSEAEYHCHELIAHINKYHKRLYYNNNNNIDNVNNRIMGINTIKDITTNLAMILTRKSFTPTIKVTIDNSTLLLHKEILTMKEAIDCFDNQMKDYISSAHYNFSGLRDVTTFEIENLNKIEQLITNWDKI